ncbi:MAG: TIGR03000 domain-containing protein [Planctomycetes bacterium]|nr:TIGR03000 domain-containing protein [Planctomycetota bacterium]
MTFKRGLLAAVVAISAVAMMTESSHAFFGRWRGGSCGSSGGSWGSRGSWGSHGGWGWRGSWGSHGGSWGGSWGGSHGSYGGVYYSSGGYARTGVVYDRVVVREPAPVVVASAPAVKTRLTLNVPAEAKVTLAGVATKQTGEVRQFSTTKLSAGQVWGDYKVVVEMEKDGQTLREERTLKLTGGQPQELTVNFDSNQLAQR